MSRVFFSRPFFTAPTDEDVRGCIDQDCFLFTDRLGCTLFNALGQRHVHRVDSESASPVIDRPESELVSSESPLSTGVFVLGLLVSTVFDH